MTMPIGNPMGYIKGAKNISVKNATKKMAGKSSGAMSTARNSRIGQAIVKNPRKAMAIGAAGVVGAGLSRSRRSGLDKGKTGMYNY
jgi:hypothetical protein